MWPKALGHWDKQGSVFGMEISKLFHALSGKIKTWPKITDAYNKYSASKPQWANESRGYGPL